MTRALTDLTKKSEQFCCQAECQEAFDMLKKCFDSTPILRHFDTELQCIIEYDIFDFTISAILLQEVEGCQHLVAFHSRKMTQHEFNYEINDKELLKISSAFQ